jgi:hypothetical protein
MLWFICYYLIYLCYYIVHTDWSFWLIFIVDELLFLSGYSEISLLIYVHVPLDSNSAFIYMYESIANTRYSNTQNQNYFTSCITQIISGTENVFIYVWISWYFTDIICLIIWFVYFIMFVLLLFIWHCECLTVMIIVIWSQVWHSGKLKLCNINFSVNNLVCIPHG